MKSDEIKACFLDPEGKFTNFHDIANNEVYLE
jgi:hypothetical protein